MQPEDLTRVLAEYGPKVRAYFRARANSPEDAEDLYQECMCALVSSWIRFAGRSSVSTWVYAICRNIYSGYVYRKTRDRALLEALRSEPSCCENDQNAELGATLERLSPLQRRLYQLQLDNVRLCGCSVLTWL
jgi:RNA polymerase sigma factor (sigma-70 family)